MAFWNRKRQFHSARAGTTRRRGASVYVDVGNKFKLQPTYNGPDSLATNINQARGKYYRYIRDNIPLVGGAVWAWTKLCNTPQSIRFDLDDGREESAKNIIDDLRGHVLENCYMRGDGFTQLNQIMFTELFTVGSFAGQLVRTADGAVDFFKTIDIYKLDWERSSAGWLLKYTDDDGNQSIVRKNDFFCATLAQDHENPFSVSPLSTIPFVLEIEQRFLEDMAKSSHNTGFPRLQVKIAPPEPFNNEKSKEYTSRANAYFDDTVELFKELDVDENVYTWSDVEVSLIGGDKNRTFTWKIHREQLIEDIITGMKLFPWVLGRSHGTTKEWVRSQYNLLMQEVDSVQNSARNLVEWICREELKAHKIDANPYLQFEPNKDPFEKEREETFGKRIDNLDRLLEKEVITDDEYKSALRARFLST